MFWKSFTALNMQQLHEQHDLIRTHWVYGSVMGISLIKVDRNIKALDVNKLKNQESNWPIAQQRITHCSYVNSCGLHGNCMFI